MKEITYELKIDSRRIGGAYGTHVNMIYQYPDQWLLLCLTKVFYLQFYSGVLYTLTYVNQLSMLSLALFSKMYSTARGREVPKCLLSLLLHQIQHHGRRLMTKSGFSIVVQQGVGNEVVFFDIVC